MTKTRFQRLKEKDTQRLFAVLLSGKMLGIASILGIMKALTWLVGEPAGASTLGDVAHKANDMISPINTVWTLVAAFLVFFMQAGFMALEAGFSRSRETVNVLMECIFDTCLCGILYWAIGFAFQFGLGNGLIGWKYFFLSGAGPTYDYGGLFDTKVAFLAFFLFQFAFADTASTVTSGAMVGRTSFKGDILYSIGVSGFIYPIFGHWVWGPGGWLGNTMGWFNGMFANADGTMKAVYRDFAGSSVVHMVGGVLALAGCYVLGPRIGRTFKRDGGGPLPPHDLTMGAIGAVILWFGWYGFNPGSTLSGMDFEGIGRVAANTTLAACAAGLVAVFVVYPRGKTWDMGTSINGFLGGLVAITAPCYWVSPGWAVLIGAVAGLIVPYATDLMEYFRLDDPIGAVPVHFACGVWGCLSIGLFAGGFGLPGPDGADNSLEIKGLFEGGGTTQLLAQVVGVLACIIVVGGVGFILMKVISLLPGQFNLRVSRDGELEGLDIHEHGVTAYHVEFGQGMTYSTPAGSSSSDPLKEKTPV